MTAGHLALIVAVIALLVASWDRLSPDAGAAALLPRVERLERIVVANWHTDTEQAKAIEALRALRSEEHP